MSYVVSDIHGCYEEYLDLMNRQNVTYIIGNHDYLFLYFIHKLGLDLSEAENMSEEDISDFQTYLKDGGLSSIEA